VDVNGIMKSECKMDQQDFSVCSSPMTYNGLTEGNHTFVVRVTDNAGNVSTPLSYEFAVDTLPPMVKIDSAPGTLTNSNSASFAFSTTMQSMDTFECKL